MSPVSTARRPAPEQAPTHTNVSQTQNALRFPLPEGLTINQRQRICRAAMEAAMCHGALVESGARSLTLFLDDRSLPVAEAQVSVHAAIDRLLADLLREHAEWTEWLRLHPHWLQADVQ